LQFNAFTPKQNRLDAGFLWLAIIANTERLFRLYSMTWRSFTVGCARTDGKLLGSGQFTKNTNPITHHEWTQRLQPGISAHPTPYQTGMPALPDLDDWLLDNDGIVHNPRSVEPVKQLN